MAEIKLCNVTKRFDKTTVVDRINLKTMDREFCVLVGPSGCGKSTTLRMIAGLDDLTDGQIFIGNKDVTNVPPKDRDIAMVFQNYALYPHMNVYKNMSFGLKFRGFSKTDISQRVNEVATILGIKNLLDRKPKELSGGQRQRVAMGRSIVRQPEAFLFDEPLSNLDAKLRVQMRAELTKLHQRLQKTIIYVTHDQVEAMTLASQIVVMKDGRFMQTGDPREVYDNPKNLFVAGFIGSPAMNFIKVVVIENKEKLLLKADTFELVVPEHMKKKYLKAKNQKAILGIRPEHIFVAKDKGPFSGGEHVKFKVEVVEFVGSEVVLISSRGPDQLTACVDPQVTVRPGTEIDFLIDMNQMHLFNLITEESFLD